MRTQHYHKTFFSSLLLIFSFFSCNNEDRQILFLNQAQETVEDNPEEALKLLDSIVDPKKLSKNDYMNYIVTLVQAKSKLNLDIRSDTLIFEAESYFSQKQDYYKAALANIYAGNVNYSNKIPEKALGNYLQGEDYAKKDNNNLLIGRSQNNIGFTYFEQEMMDSAITYFRKTCASFDREQLKTKNIDSYKMMTLTAMGRAQSAIEQTDSAYACYEKALLLAKKTNNQKYIGILMNNISVQFREQKEYEKALSYLHQALTYPIDSENVLRVYFNKSRIYSLINQPDSCKYYLESISEQLPNIKDKYFLQGIYKSLADYYGQDNEQEKSLYYRNLYTETYKKINTSNNSRRLLETEKQYQLSILQKEKDEAAQKLYIGAGIFVAIIILIIIWFRYKHFRYKYLKEIEKNELLKKQYDLKIENLSFLKKIYHNIVCEWISIDKEVEALATEYGATEKPTIYKRIKQLLDNLQEKTDQQLIQSAKAHIEKEPYGKEILAELDEDDLLLLGLCFYDYSKSDISSILDIPIQKVYTRKLKLKHDFKEAGIPNNQIEQLLFTNNN